MRRLVFLAFVGLACLFSPGASAQGVLGDVLSGNLVNPEVGQWAWYNLIDSATQKRYLLRQAVVGEEKVGRKMGHWLEVEVVPDIGFPTVYKMLLTGPASNPKHVHRVLLRQGNNPVSEMPLEPDAPVENGEAPKRNKLGKVDVETPAGIVEAEHIVIESGEQPIELWLNDDVRPMGVVQMRGPQGELTLRNYGEGGEYAQSRLNLFASTNPESVRRPSTRVETGILDGPDEMRAREDRRAGSATPPKE